jgi:flagellar protein FliO/FliZ
MQWLEQLPFADNRVVQIGFLAACGIAALVVLAILYRLVFAHRLRVPGGRTRQPRLGLVDAFSLDGQRQLVLVRRDNVEHLVMIGGPNDVLVESQINRALTPARENNQASPLLAPGAAGRRTETPLAAAPVVAEAPPPAKAAASAPAAPKAPAPAPASAPPKAAVAVPVPAAPKAPASAPPLAAPKPPASATANTSATVSAPTNVSAPAPVAKPAEPELAPRSAPVPPQTAQTPEPDWAAPPSSPRPPRPPMPPPIVPAAGAANRATVTRLTEKVPPRPSPVSGNPPAPSAAVAAPPRPEKTEAAAAPVEARPSPPAPIVVAPSPAPAPARPAAKTPPPEAGQKIGEARPPADKPNPITAKPAKVDDPFADLDSLEAEMARLLGREKMG